MFQRSASFHNVAAALPPGWEQGQDDEGRVYFIDHSTQVHNALIMVYMGYMQVICYSVSVCQYDCHYCKGVGLIVFPRLRETCPCC